MRVREREWMKRDFELFAGGLFGPVAASMIVTTCYYMIAPGKIAIYISAENDRRIILHVSDSHACKQRVKSDLE